MTAILGLNASHPDSSACLVIDGKLVGAVAEERLGARRKHTMAFPIDSIKWLLSSSGLRLRDLTHVAISRNPHSNFAAKAIFAILNPSLGIQAALRLNERRRSATSSLDSLAHLLHEDPAQIKYKVHSVEHHLAHIASAYYLSPFDQLTAGFSFDGSGDFVSAMAARCEGNTIDVIKRVTVPHSLGHFYTAMCQFIGFDLFGEEYKVMGLAPYGNDRYSEELRKIISLDEDKWFRLDNRFLSVNRGLREAQLEDCGEMRMGPMYSSNLVNLLGQPRQRNAEISQREMDIARSTQVRFEEVAEYCLRQLHRRVPLTRLVMAGGCALNGVMNAKIHRVLPVEDAYLQPASSDDGTAIGAAFHCWHAFLGNTQRFQMTHSYWGPEHPKSAIRKAVEQSGRRFHYCSSDEELTRRVAQHIADGDVVGWYQGRSEWGPRALGNRSILANPAIKDMKTILNKKIKKRESFRPFAPSVLREEVSRFFEQDIHSPFMMHVVRFKSQWRDVFPAVVHVDGTGRLQSVDQESNSLYYNLILAVKRITGYGIVLNTSFNENEPIVDTPDQAVSVFMRTDMDVLAIGRYIVVK